MYPMLRISRYNTGEMCIALNEMYKLENVMLFSKYINMSVESLVLRGQVDITDEFCRNFFTEVIIYVLQFFSEYFLFLVHIFELFYVYYINYTLF